MSLDAHSLLQHLVAFDSTSSKPSLPIASFVGNYLQGTGISCQLIESEDGQHASVIASTGEQPSVALSGHLDVVPATEPDWTSDPFDLRSDGTWLYGRGVCDMKGFVAIAMNTLLESAAAGIPLMLILTHSEEVGSLGAEQLIQHWRWHKPSHIIIGEPTSLRAVRLHKGHLKLRVQVLGRSAHSGYPGAGANAIEHAIPVLDALSRLRRQLESERNEASATFPETPHAPLNLATVAAGAAINIIPDRCTIEVGVRPLPGQAIGTLAQRIEDAAQAGARQAGASITIDVLGANPPLDTPADARLFTELCKLTGSDHAPSVNFASDAGYLSSIGTCTLFGPGDMTDAHRPNERLRASDLELTQGLLRKCIAALSGTSA